MVVCAWCDGSIVTSGTGGKSRPAHPRGHLPEPSHGICPSCAATQLALLARPAGPAPALALR